MVQRSFRASLFQNSQKKISNIELSPKGILQTDENQTLGSYSDFTLEQGGANNHLLFFKSKTRDLVFYVDLNKELLETLSSIQDIAVKDFLTQHRADKKKNQIIFFIVFFIIFVIGYSLLSATQSIPDKLVDSIPYEYEQKIGDTLFLAHKSNMIDDEKLKSYLKKSLAPLIPVLPEEFQGIKIFISNDSSLNAYAMPGGYIVFHKGLLKEAENEREILGVAAHEFAHMTQRHILKNITKTAGLFVLVQTFFGDFSGILAIIADQGTSLLGLSFSREMEEEADSVGVNYLKEARINPLGMKEFFERLVKEDKTSELMENFEFLSTHPGSKSRIENINQLIEADQRNYNKLSNENLRNIQQRLEEI